MFINLLRSVYITGLGSLIYFYIFVFFYFNILILGATYLAHIALSIVLIFKGKTRTVIYPILFIILLPNIVINFVPGKTCKYFAGSEYVQTKDCTCLGIEKTKLRSPSTQCIGVIRKCYELNLKMNYDGELKPSNKEEIICK